MQVGFIGLGHMGQHMARHIAEAGHDVAAFDLRPEAIAQLTQTPHARRAASVAEAALDAELVFTSLPGPPEVEAVAAGPDGLLDSMKPGAVYIDLSSNSPAVVRKLCAAFAERGITMLDAPVAGGVEGAEAGTLSVMVGGEKAAFDRVEPTLKAIGTRIFYCGPSGNGSVVKLCNNLSSQAQNAAAGEILSLGVKAGVDLEILAGVIAVSTGTCRAIANTFPKQLFARNFENPGFSSFLSAKDTHLALELAHELGVPMEIGEIVERDKQEALRRGWGPLSPDVFVRLQEERAGVVLEIKAGDRDRDRMIKRFSVLYVGHIALDNVGRDGTPADERRYPNERLVEAMAMAEDVAHTMDELGYETLWMAEHHFQREGYECLPNLILMGTYLATQTRRLKFGCAFNVTPMWHPVRLAEDFAMADYLTRGRIVMGVGRGYHTREVESLGGPLLDAEANAALFREQMDILFKAFDQEAWSHAGRFYTIPAPVDYRGYRLRDVTLVPRPVNRPVEMWQAIASGKSIPFMVQHAIKGMVTMNGELITRQIFGQYRNEAARIGRHLAPGEDLAWGGGLFLAPTLEEAIEGVRPFHDERFKWFAPFGFVRYADEHGRPWGTPGAPTGVPTIEEGVRQKAWLVGSPAMVLARLKELEAEYPGLEDIVLHWPEGMSAADWQAQLRQFAREVMPAFQPVPAAAGRSS